MSVDVSHYAPDFLIKVNGKSFRLGAQIDILSISITESAEGSDSFQMSVRDRHRTLARFPNGEELAWIDSDQFNEGNDIEIEMGYVGNRTLKFVGKITAVSISFPSSGIPTLSIQGQSLYTQLQRGHQYKPFASKRDSDIVREIAGNLGLRPQVEETNTEHETVSYPGVSYAKILEDRAKRLNYEVGVKERTLYFQKPRYLDNARAQFTLKWGENLLQFTPRVTTNNIPTEVRQRSPQTALGGAKDKPIVSTIKATEFQPRLGKQSGPQITKDKFGDNIQQIAEHRVESPEEGKRVVMARMERQALGYIQGNGDTIGEPQLVSRKVIELQGLGRKFSGKYYVTSTTHKIDANGYQTSFTAKRDGI